MEDYFYKNNTRIIEDDLSDKRELIKKLIDKKRKIKAYEIPAKEFFSDDEDEFKKNNFGIINKYTNQRKIKIKRMYKYNQNSLLLYKDQLQKKSTIDQTPNKKRERQNILIEDIDSETTVKNKISKKVNFPKNNFVVYIDIESYKKYNCNNSNKYAYSEDKIKCDSKCCLIY